MLFTRVAEDADIVELPLEGTPPRKLLATAASEYSPAWSPQGGEFAYLTGRKRLSFAKINPCLKILGLGK